MTELTLADTRNLVRDLRSARHMEFLSSNGDESPRENLAMSLNLEANGPDANDTSSYELLSDNGCDLTQSQAPKGILVSQL